MMQESMRLCYLLGGIKDGSAFLHALTLGWVLSHVKQVVAM